MDPLGPALKSEVIEELLKSAKSPEALFGPNGLLHQLKGALMERMLEAEMEEHLGFEKNGSGDTPGGNTRNGYTEKTVKTETGPVRIRVPRDRAGTFEPKVVAKHQRRLEGFDDKVLALYARGMTVREIQGHLRELYGTEVAPDLISRVTDAALDEAHIWQSRPLDRVYPIVYLDALFVYVRDGGLVRKKAVYLALGVTLEGVREVLGIWVESNEHARFWLSVLTDLKNRGVEDIFFVCCDGLTGFPQAVEAAFPKTIVQTCIVHMIRNSLRYVSTADKKALTASLRLIYSADSEESARNALVALEETWSTKYPTIAKSWRARWAEVVPFLQFPREIRVILYTTNAIESLNFQLRKVLKPRGHFPNDEAVIKLMYLAIQRAEVHWRPMAEWKRALAHFSIVFADRFPA